MLFLSDQYCLCAYKRCNSSLLSSFSPSLVSLLGYAEEELHCKATFVFFDNSVTVSWRKQIVHDFQFMGFELLSPSHPHLPVRVEGYLFMAYQLECEDDSSDSEED